MMRIMIRFRTIERKDKKLCSKGENQFEITEINNENEIEDVTVWMG